MPELEKIAYVFLHRLFAVFRPTETSAVDGIMKKYSDELIALMGCVAKKYVDGTQAANMLKAVLNLKTVDPESFGKEYLEQSLRAADALMEELDTADPELPKFGQPKIGAKTGDGPRRGRKADREQPDEPQRSRSGRQQRSATPSRRTARSATPARSSWQKGGEEYYDWREYQRRKREAAEEREQDSAEKGRTPDTLSAGRISWIWASTQTCQVRSIPSTSILSLTGMQEQARSRYMYGYSALLGRTVL